MIHAVLFPQPGGVSLPFRFVLAAYTLWFSHTGSWLTVSRGLWCSWAEERSLTCGLRLLVPLCSALFMDPRSSCLWTAACAGPGGFEALHRGRPVWGCLLNPKGRKRRLRREQCPASRSPTNQPTIQVDPGRVSQRASQRAVYTTSASNGKPENRLRETREELIPSLYY